MKRSVTKSALPRSTVSKTYQAPSDVTLTLGLSRRTENASANILLKARSAKIATPTTSGQRIHLVTLCVNLIHQSALMSFATGMAHALRELVLLNAFVIRDTLGSGARNALIKISSTLSVMVMRLISQRSKVA